MFFLVFLFGSCCSTGYYLSNNQKDFAGSSECQCVIQCGKSSVGTNRYAYAENPEEQRFIYEISISFNERSAVILNAFQLTNLDNTPIIAKYYVETYTRATTNTLRLGVSQKEHSEAYTRDSLSTKIDKLTWELDSLPALLRDLGERKAHRIRIMAETNKPYSKIEGLKVHYDFEVGKNRYISENIEYKWHRYTDCRPKFW
jgi:outer membrane protease